MPTRYYITSPHGYRSPLMTRSAAEAKGKKIAADGVIAQLFEHDDPDRPHREGYYVKTFEPTAKKPTSKKISFLVVRAADENEPEDGWEYPTLAGAMKQVAKKEALGFKLSVIKYEGESQLGVVYRTSARSSGAAHKHYVDYDFSTGTAALYTNGRVSATIRPRRKFESSDDLTYFLEYNMVSVGNQKSQTVGSVLREYVEPSGGISVAEMVKAFKKNMWPPGHFWRDSGSKTFR